MNFNSVFEELNKLYETDAVVENFENDNGVKAWSKNVISYYEQAAKELGLVDYTMKLTTVGGEEKAVITAVKDGKKLSAEESNVAMTHDVKSVADAKEQIQFVFDLDEALSEATIYTTRAEMAKLDKAVEDAQKEVAKYSIPMKRNSAGESEPDFEAVPENQREAAKAAHDKYQKALAARPSRSQNIIKYKDDMDESLNEAADEEEIEIVDDEMTTEDIPVEEEPVEEARQLIIECSKCGGLVIKDEADVVVDEESDFVNVDDECEYCEEKAGYKIVGVVAPYEAAEIEVTDEVEAHEEAEEVAEEEVVD